MSGTTSEEFLFLNSSMNHPKCVPIYRIVIHCGCSLLFFFFFERLHLLTQFAMYLFSDSSMYLSSYLCTIMSCITLFVVSIYFELYVFIHQCHEMWLIWGNYLFLFKFLRIWIVKKKQWSCWSSINKSASG